MFQRLLSQNRHTLGWIFLMGSRKLADQNKPLGIRQYRLKTQQYKSSPLQYFGLKQLSTEAVNIRTTVSQTLLKTVDINFFLRGGGKETAKMRAKVSNRTERLLTNRTPILQ